MELVIRVLLYAVVAAGGCLLGSVAGFAVGALVEVAFETPEAGPDGIVYAYSWAGLILGGLFGSIAAILWLSLRMRAR